MPARNGTEPPSCSAPIQTCLWPGCCKLILWRWGVEVNFRDEKTLIGTGDAQVLTISSNQHLPAVTVAAYALLWVATLGLLAGGGRLPTLDPPKWRKDRQAARQLPSTGKLLRLLRYELWAGAL